MQKLKSKLEFSKKYRYLLVYIVVILTLSSLYILDLVELGHYSRRIKQDLSNAFEIKTTGCRIPFLNPYDALVRKYIYKVHPINCSQVEALVKSTINSIYVDQEQLANYNISNSTVECCYQPFWRVNPNSYQRDGLYSFGKCVNFYPSANISDEFIKVLCKLNENEIYKDFFSFVPIKPYKKTSRNKLNVLIIGLDAISRLNFYRQLPRTRSYLKKTLNAIEMVGYNKVGDNTFPNLIPLLTGQSVRELSKSCWPTTVTKFDECDFIWNNYSKEGYLTAFAEDSSWMGVFNYLKFGFMKQPTDYYWRTFNLLAEKEIGHLKPFNAQLCIGTRPTYQVLLNYIQKFIINLRLESFFGFFWETSLSHDNINYPAQGDVYYETVLKFLKKSNVLNNTVLIVLSDHGIRWGEIRSTHQGNLEERLPSLFMVLPFWFEKEYSTAARNIRTNSKRLTTPFDLHETLVDILNYQQLTTENIEERSKDLNNSRGISLFLPVPESRTCSSAKISAHWCTCQKSIVVDTNSSTVQNIAHYIISHLNDLIKNYTDCIELKLDSILDARLTISSDYLKNNFPLNDYKVVLIAQPSGGIFEATVRCIQCNDINSFELTGVISRLNLYGEQSACINDYQLKLYCYCKS